MPDQAMIRAFFYLSGFTAGDGNLRVIARSHTWREPNLGERLRAWREQGKTSHKVRAPQYVTYTHSACLLRPAVLRGYRWRR